MANTTLSGTTSSTGVTELFRTRLMENGIMENITHTVPTLMELNDAEVLRLIPTIVYLGIISVAGIFGNGLVCHIYRTRYRLSNSQCFILCLSAIDLFSCSVVIPFEITTVIDQYTFQYLWLCKFSRFFNTLSTLSSSFLLLFIAIDRYRKVCKPFCSQISAKVAKFLCVLAVLLSLLFSWPAVLVYGKKTFPIPEYNMTGTECSTDDSMADTMYPFINVSVYGVLFLSGIISMSILYCLIGREVHKHANRMPKELIQSCNSVPMLSSSMVDRGSKIEGGADPSTITRYQKTKAKNEENRKRAKRFKKKHRSASELSWSEKRDEVSGEQFEMRDRNDKGELIEKDNTAIENTSTERKDTEKNDDIHQDSKDTLPKDVKMEENDLNLKSNIDNVYSNKADEIAGDTKVVTEKENGIHTPNSNSPISSEESLNKERKSLGGRLLSITSHVSIIMSRVTSFTSRHSESSTGTLGKTQYLKQARARKTAFLMFLISLAFVLSYLPHLLLMIIRALKSDFVEKMTDTERAAYKFFLRSYFLNCAINPLIYAVCASRFRTECKDLFSSMCGRAGSEDINLKK